MGEPTDPMHQPDPIDAIRTLLQTVQGELDTFAELSAGAVELLAALERPLGLVDFSPFAQWTGNEAVTRPSAPPQGNGATAANPLITTRPRNTPELSAQQAATATAASPVFTLPRRVPAPMPTSTIAASTPDTQTPTPGDQAGAEAAVLLTAMTMVDTLAAALLDTTAVASPDSTARSSLGESTLLHQLVNGERLSATIENNEQPPWPMRLPVEPTRPQVIDPLVVNHGLPGLSLLPSTTGQAGAADAHATMALLATVTDALLTRATIADAKPVAVQASAQAGTLSSLMPILAPTAESHRTPLPSIGTLPAPDFSPVTEGTWPSATAAPFAEPSAASLSAPPPDAWTLAQLINDVLAEEARRHGVDLL